MSDSLEIPASAPGWERREKERALAPFRGELEAIESLPHATGSTRF